MESNFENISIILFMKRVIINNVWNIWYPVFSYDIKGDIYKEPSYTDLLAIKITAVFWFSKKYP